MKSTLKIAILVSLFASYDCLAALPEHPEQLSYEQLTRIVDDFQLRKEDCQLFLLQDMNNVFLKLMIDKQVPKKQGMPYAKKIAHQIMECKKAHLAHVGKQ